MKFVAFTPLKNTPVAFVKLLPLIVIVSPTIPLPGLNPLTIGRTKKLATVVAVPPGAVTEIGPLLAFKGTDEVIEVLFTTPNIAGTPLKLTSVALVKLTPVIVTFVPGAPLVGVKRVMFGGKKKFVVLTVIPFVVATVMGPLVAVSGTVAVN